MSDIEKWFKEELERTANEVDRIKSVQMSIKHPHFYYAVYDMDTGEVTYKKKKWYKWFSGKRIVFIKVKPVVTEGLADYSNCYHKG